MKPSIGRIVHYTISDHDAEMINRRRVAKPHEPGWPAGAVAHSGNSVRAGEIYPLIITRVWNEDPGTINGQVLLDGNDSLWVTSVLPSGVEGRPAAPSPCTYHRPRRRFAPYHRPVIK